MITVIVFDFYGVFQVDPYEHWLKENSLTRTGDYLSLVQKLDAGHIDRHEFILKLGILHGREVGYDEMYSEESINQEVVKLVQSLKARYKIGLLSNASSKSLKRTLNDNDLEYLFDQVIISGDVGITKPAKEIYELSLRKLEANPHAALFIDDNPLYVQAAQNIGAAALIFTSVDHLRDALVELELF